MYLKRIEMRGFKSFADKTVIDFQQGVTCVVGPNGSGKSNITDAVRWVLGEQRIKTLRGSKMEDVIFNGTKHRKSLGLAEVKLIFDNTEQFFPLEYDEISVTRRVHRSGESEYSINQMPCRLKDVRELFMDTGIGREGYSIIGQGRIDEVLSNNKDERRMLFEEAAGIVKYKMRKTDSEKKLKNTNDNLLRIQDILSEIEDRVDPLRIESERAEKYLELSEMLRNIELKAFATRYASCEQSILDVISSRSNLEDDLKALNDRVDDLNKVYSLKDQELYAFNRKLRSTEETLYELSNKESRILGEKQLIEEKIINFDANIKRIHEELEEIDQQYRGSEVELKKHMQEKDSIESDYALLKSKVDELTLQKEVYQNALAKLKTDNEHDRQVAFEILNQIELKNREIENYKHFKNQIGNRLGELDVQLNGLRTQLNESASNKSTNETALTQINKEIDSANSKLAEQLKSMQYFKDERHKLTQKNESHTLKHSQLLTEKKLLETMEEEFEGYDKGVREILTRLPDQSGIHGIVATLVEVPKHLETAIEIALGKAIQNIVCDYVSDAKRSIEFLRKNNIGRVTFLPLENLRAKDAESGLPSKITSMDGFVGIGSDLVKVSPVYKGMINHLLGRVLIARDFDTASEILKVPNLRYKIITLEGDVLVPGGHITGGAFKPRANNMLGRKRRISELTESLETLSREMNEIQIKIKQSADLHQESEELIKRLRNQLDTLRMDQLKVQNHMENQLQWQASIKSQISKLNNDFTSLEAESKETEENIELLLEEINSLDQKSKELEVSLSSGNQDISNEEANLQSSVDQLTRLKIDLASLEQILEFKDKEIARFKDDLVTIDQKKNLRNSQLKTYEDSKAIMTEQVVKIGKSIEGNHQQIIDLKSELELLNTTKKTFSEEVSRLTLEISEMGRKQDAIKESLHKLEVKMAKLEVEKDVVVSELWDKYEMSIAEAMQVDHNVPAAEVKQLKQELKVLGSVNINAIKEYEEVSERYRFLSEQKKDLSDSIKQLEKIIRDLDRKMIDLFKTNFEMINEHFKNTFSALFNGGAAELLLTDYDDLLNCDIEIIAQPPGKKLQSINLLSGGEKALTAIALLFAILKTKPSPFCILDEIEAALDDVNVYRFAAFIKEYARQSQFVVITHRKGTMEIADTLYGVTMEEYGISKILSVRLEDVEEKFN